MKRESTIEQELRILLEKEKRLNSVEIYDAKENFSKEAIELMQNASKSNVGYNCRIVPININGKKCCGIEINQASETGISYDGDKTNGYNFFRSKKVVPVYEKDKLELESIKFNQRMKKLDSLSRIGKKYFSNGIMPREIPGWKEYLNNNISSSLISKLEALITAIQESDIMDLNKEKSSVFLEKYIDDFLKEEKSEKKENEKYDKAFKASLIRERYNSIAKKYFKSGWPSEYGFERALNNSNTPEEIKQRLKEIIRLSSKVCNLPMEEYYFKLEPLINDFDSFESELDKIKNSDIDIKRKTYKKKSFLEKLKEKLLNKDKKQDDSMKM